MIDEHRMVEHAAPRPQMGDGHSKHTVSDLVMDIARDVATLARDEVTLAKLELESKLEQAALTAAAIALSGALGLIGFALLCATAVVALEPAMPALWGRMLLMAGCYLLLGGLGSAIFLAQLKRKASRNPAPRATREARETVTAAQREVRGG